MEIHKEVKEFVKDWIDEIEREADFIEDEPCQGGDRKRGPEGSKLLFSLMNRMPYPVQKPKQTMFDLSKYDKKIKS